MSVSVRGTHNTDNLLWAVSRFWTRTPAFIPTFPAVRNFALNIYCRRWGSYVHKYLIISTTRVILFSQSLSHETNIASALTSERIDTCIRYISSVTVWLILTRRSRGVYPAPLRISTTRFRGFNTIFRRQIQLRIFGCIFRGITKLTFAARSLGLRWPQATRRLSSVCTMLTISQMPTIAEREPRGNKPMVVTDAR